MAELFGIGGSAAKTDRKYQLQSWGELNDMFGAEKKRGLSTLDTGLADTGKAKDYWSALMSGDPTKMSAVLAPQISTIKKQSGQQIAGLNQFSGRSGGTAAAVQQANTEALSSIQNLFDMLGPTAAEEFTKLAGFETETGRGLLEDASASAAEVGQQAGASRPGDQQMQQQQQQAIIQGIGSLLALA
jgi:hypothetical protein